MLVFILLYSSENLQLENRVAVSTFLLAPSGALVVIMVY